MSEIDRQLGEGSIEGTDLLQEEEGNKEDAGEGASQGEERPPARQRPRSRSRRRRRRGRKNNNRMPVIVGAAFVAVVVLLALLSIVIKKYSPSKERADLDDYYNIQSQEDAAIILDGIRLEETAKLWDGHVYMDYKIVQEYLNQRFYWDSNENILRYTTDKDVVSVNAGSMEYTVTKKNENTDYVIVKVDGEHMYLALDFVQKYTNIEFAMHEAPNRVKITAKWGEIQTAPIRKNTAIRVKGGIKSPIVADLEKGSKVGILDAGENWSRVCTEDGMIGWLQNKRLGEISVESISREFEEPVFTHMLKDGSVSLGWHQVTNQEANGRVASILQDTKGVNVISPTWFYLNDNEGNIYSLASREYVSYCHQNNVEVWALVSNLENPEADSAYVLSHTSTRDYLTNQIIAAAIEYDLDGINLDFESITEERAPHYLEFIRELSVSCRNNRLLFSVDDPVPQFSSHYGRREQALVADYVIIMGYDEHYSGSQEAGSNASLPFVEQGIQDTLAEVPASRVINAMPFYTRLWTETYGTGELSCETMGMDEAAAYVSENQMEIYWDADLGQNVSERDSGEALYRIWLEDTASLAEKLKLIDKYQLAGGAFWKLGFENAAVWATVQEYL